MILLTFGEGLLTTVDMFCHRCGREAEALAFCSNCGVKIRRNTQCLPLRRFLTQKDAIGHYFNGGFKYQTVINFLKQHHDINISLRTLKRRLVEYGLTKKGNVSVQRVRSVIEHEIKGPSALLGYRSMWHLLRISYGIIVPRDIVATTLKDIDPEGTETRKARRLKRRNFRSPGANYSWHIDGYDKLKPYGFPIHGAVDGFSRRILWLKVTRTNNNPVVPAGFYVHTMEELKKCPTLIQTDYGTENGIMAGIQCTLQQDASAHRYGKSVANQRIENWWSHCRRGYTHWIIDFFKSMVFNGLFVVGSYVHTECAWFVFSQLLQSDLDQVKERWNSHFIRKSNDHVIGGVPNEMFFLPASLGFQECGTDVTSNDINRVLQNRDYLKSEASQSAYCFDDNLYRYFYYVIQKEGMPFPPCDWKEGRNIFRKIMEVSGY